MNSRKGIIIFIKNPIPGKVKTRLARDLGNDKAVKIYKALLSYTHSIVKEIEAQRYLFYADYINEEDDWSNDEFIKGLQHQGGLGDRIEDAFATALQKCSKVLIIGSDCPQIKTHHIEEAFKLLDKKELVIGPTLDGGYYLLGMKSVHKQLLEDIPWSSGQEFEVTVRRALKNNLSIDILPSLADVDYREDWEKYGWEI